MSFRMYWLVDSTEDRLFSFVESDTGKTEKKLAVVT